MEIKINTNKISYELTLNGKYNFLCGDSGTGKTTFHKLLTQHLLSPRAVKVSSDIKLYPVQALDDGEVLQKHRGELLVIDERAIILKDTNIATMLKESPNYFLIISRKKFNFIPVSIDNYYKLKNINGVMHNEPIYPRFCNNNFSGVDIIVTEDSVSGYKFFKEFFPKIPVVSAHSKSELALFFEQKYVSGKRYLAVYDAAAFAFEAEKFFEKIRGKSVQILDWESFENFILRQECFNIKLEQKDCDYTQESLEEYSTEVLCKLLGGYSKSNLPRCIRINSNCSDCQKISTCKYKHKEFYVNLKINENQTDDLSVFSYGGNNDKN